LNFNDFGGPECQKMDFPQKLDFPNKSKGIVKK